MVLTSQLKVGSVFKMGDDLLAVTKMQGNKSGRGAQVVKFRVKNLITGGTQDIALNGGDKFEEVDLDVRKTSLSYIDGETFVFMDNDTYEQIELSREDLGDNAGYILPEDEMEVGITFYEGKAIGMKLPVAVIRTISYCEPGIKGDSSGKSLKPATLDTGLETMVPLFCEIDSKIKVDTRDGSFVERVK
jgi:elongation factor P